MLTEIPYTYNYYKFFKQFSHMDFAQSGRRIYILWCGEEKKYLIPVSLCTMMPTKSSCSCVMPKMSDGFCVYPVDEISSAERPLRLCLSLLPLMVCYLCVAIYKFII